MSNSGIYETFLRPLLFKMDPEEAHRFIYSIAPAYGLLAPLLRGAYSFQAANLSINLAGKKLANPVGLAAGFDKNGHLVSLLGDLGFGFAEVGSVTGQASQGNPRPRLFRLPEDEAVINRMGLNGDGAAAVATRLASARFSLPVALNIAKTNDPSLQGDKAVEDHVISFKAIMNLPAAYVAINASCPNTEEGKLQQKHELDLVLAEIQKVNIGKLPLFIKASPDSTDALLDDLVELSHRHDVSGFICGNTSIGREQLNTAASEIERIGKGGLSGRPIKGKALNLVRRVFRHTGSSKQIIACGGIASGQDAYDFIAAGATAVQLYTALVYKGPGLPAQICRQLSSLLESQKQSLPELVGSERQSTKSA